MAWDKWVIDASMGWPPCFCPLEGDLDGEYSIVIGLNLLGCPPKEGKVVAIVHEGGQAVVDAFYEAHKTELDELLGKTAPPHTQERDGD